MDTKPSIDRSVVYFKWATSSPQRCNHHKNDADDKSVDEIKQCKEQFRRNKSGDQYESYDYTLE